SYQSSFECDKVSEPANHWQWLAGSNSSQRDSTNGQSYPIISLPDLEYSCAVAAMRRNRWLTGSGSNRVAELNRRGTSVRFPTVIRTLPSPHPQQIQRNSIMTDTTPDYSKSNTTPIAQLSLQSEGVFN